MTRIDVTRLDGLVEEIQKLNAIRYVNALNAITGETFKPGDEVEFISSDNKTITGTICNVDGGNWFSVVDGKGQTWHGHSSSLVRIMIKKDVTDEIHRLEEENIRLDEVIANDGRASRVGETFAGGPQGEPRPSGYGRRIDKTLRTECAKCENYHTRRKVMPGGQMKVDGACNLVDYPYFKQHWYNGDCTYFVPVSISPSYSSCPSYPNTRLCRVVCKWPASKCIVDVDYHYRVQQEKMASP